MPNGESRNWIRLLIGMENFYAAYGHWPVRVFVDPFFIEELLQKMKPGDFELLNSKVELISEPGTMFLYEDDQGRSYDYCGDNPVQNFPRPDALAWLNVSRPDYYD